MDFDELEEDPYNQKYFTDALEVCEHVKVKFWLLDAAMQQFSSGRRFSRKKKQYLPDEVFCKPGMSEEEMVSYMTARGANKACIQYAQRKFREESSRDSSQSDSSSSEGDGKSQAYTEDATVGSSQMYSSLAQSSYIRKSWTRLKKAIVTKGSDEKLTDATEKARNKF